jgi:hypothetical protein
MIRGVDDRGPWILYYALAIAAGLVLALPSRSGVIGWAVILGGGIGAALIRSQWLHARPWSRVDISWILLCAAVFVPLALLLRTWPFA